MAYLSIPFDFSRALMYHTSKRNSSIKYGGPRLPGNRPGASRYLPPRRDGGSRTSGAGLAHLRGFDLLLSWPNTNGIRTLSETLYPRSQALLGNAALEAPLPLSKPTSVWYSRASRACNEAFPSGAWERGDIVFFLRSQLFHSAFSELVNDVKDDHTRVCRGVIHMEFKSMPMFAIGQMKGINEQ